MVDKNYEIIQKICYFLLIFYFDIIEKITAELNLLTSTIVVPKRQETINYQTELRTDKAPN